MKRERRKEKENGKEERKRGKGEEKGGKRKRERKRKRKGKGEKGKRDEVCPNHRLGTTAPTAALDGPPTQLLTRPCRRQKYT